MVKISAVKSSTKTKANERFRAKREIKHLQYARRDNKQQSCMLFHEIY